MNKIIVSVVIALVLVVGINKIADIIYNVEKPEKSAYQVATVTNTNSSTTETSSENTTTGDIMALFASVNLSDGEKVFKKCAACHSIAKGGANKIGPALYNVIGRQAGSLSDYKYSKGIVAYGKKWTPQEMDGFLENPKGWVKGTKMSYAGLKKPKERAALILYLNKNNDNPLSLQ
jgi:cytochrome c